MIKKLLYVDRFSIEGARAALRQLKREVREEKKTAPSLAHGAAIRAYESSFPGSIGPASSFPFALGGHARFSLH